MANILAPRFDNFSMPILIGPYYKIMENFVNMEREEHLKFIF